LPLAAAAGFTAPPDDRMPATAPGAAGVEPSPAIPMISTDDPGRSHVQELVQGFLAAVSEAAVPPTACVEYFDQVRFGDRPASSLGALAYVIKADAGEELVPAVRSSLGGRRLLSASAQAVLRDQAPRVIDLGGGT
jgi:hypothetical protein